MRAPTAIAFTVVLFGALSCRDATAPVSVALTMTSTPAAPRPGGTVDLVITANPESGDQLTTLGVRLDGLGGSTADSVDVSTGTPSIHVSIQLPVAFGALKVTGFAHSRKGGYAERSVTFQLADNVPPSVSPSAIQPAVGAAAQPGDLVRVAYTVSDDVRLRYVALHVTGAATLTDSVDTGPVATMPRSFSFSVPREALGKTLNVSVDARDDAGNLTRQSLVTYTVVDLTAPNPSVALTGGSGHGTYAPSDTIRFTLSATDNVALRYVGYALGAPFSIRDSTITGGSAFTKTVAIPIEGRTGSATLTLFARDSVGNGVQVPGALITIGTRTRAPVATVTLANAAAINDVAYDATRDRLYLSQPDAGRVALVSVSTAAEQGSLSVTAPLGLDVTSGGDSLLVAQRSVPALAVINLANGQQSQLAIDATRSASSVRGMANGHAVVALTFGGSGYGGNVVDVNLANGARGGQLLVTEAVPMVRSTDRQRLFGLIDDSCCPEQGFIYDAASSAFGLPSPTANRFFPPTAISPDGSRIFVDGVIYSSSLQRTGTFAAPSGYTALAAGPDPTVLFAAVSLGVARVRLSDGAVLETIAIPFTASKLYLLPDGLTLVAVGGNRASIIDLW